MNVFFPFTVLGVAEAYDSRSDSPLDMLNELLRGEISAVETYRQALEKVQGEPGSSELALYMDDHVEAVQELTDTIKMLGGKPSEGSGPWGVWAKFVMGTSKIFGDVSALKALKEGEEHGLKEYEEALRHANVPQEVKSFIKEMLVPQQQEHIAGINRMIDTAQMAS